MSRVPFSEFSEFELLVLISALECYINDMPETTYILDSCTTLLDEMIYSYNARLHLQDKNMIRR
jgi:hypothetical protein